MGCSATTVVLAERERAGQVARLRDGERDRRGRRRHDHGQRGPRGSGRGGRGRRRRGRRGRRRGRASRRRTGAREVGVAAATAAVARDRGGGPGAGQHDGARGHYRGDAALAHATRTDLYGVPTGIVRDAAGQRVECAARRVRDRVVFGDRGVVRSHRELPGIGRGTFAPRGGGTSRRLGSAPSSRPLRQRRDRRSRRARVRVAAGAGARPPGP